MSLSESISLLKSRKVVLQDGLTDRETCSIEARYRFVFPPDLRALLQTALPVAPGFPNWRVESNEIWTQLRRPIEGVLFDVQNSNFWWTAWGERPESKAEAAMIAERWLIELPPLVPIYRHSYLPCFPNVAGNPVFSIHQCDVIHRGSNLRSFLKWAFRPNVDDDDDEPTVYDASYQYISFWTDLARTNYESHVG